MRLKGFIGGAYKLNSINADCQRCVNLYPVINEAQTEKEQETGYLTTTPGLTRLLTLPTNPIRGIYTATNNALFAVAGNKFYIIDTSNFTYIELGTLNTNAGTVRMVDNGNLLCIVDGQYGYTFALTAGTLTQITDPEFQGGTFVDFLDGYFIFAIPNTGKFQYSDLYSSDIQPLSFVIAEGNPDYIISQSTLQRELWLFGKNSIEVFDTNPSTSPIEDTFIRNPSGYIEFGCVAPYSVAKCANTLIWLGSDNNGNGQVFIANGYIPQRISTFAIEYEIQGYSLISDAIAYSYQQNGHIFYVLNFPTANKTWVYDILMQVWHERAYTDSNGMLNRHRVNYHYLHNNTNYVGDWQNGKLYKFDLENYTDDGETITRLRTSPHLSQNLKYIYYHSIQLDCESGVGLSANTDPPENTLGYNPLVMMNYSNDGGHTWSNERFESMGKLGEYDKRVIWFKLGRARDRVFQFKITDPVKVILLGAEFEAVQAAA